MRKLIKWSAIITGVLLLPVGYAVAYETLSIVLPPVLYVGGAVAILSLILGAIGAATVGQAIVRTRVAELGSLRVIAAANAQMALAEAKQKKVLFFTAPRDHQLIVRDDDENRSYLQFHLSPQPYLNGIEAPVTPEQVAIYRDYHGRGPVVNEPLMIDAPAEPALNLDDYGPEWIQSIILPAPHIHYCGATRSGKTTLANHHIEWIKRQNPDAQFWLIDPKHTASAPAFIIPPQYKGIDEALEGLAKMNDILIRRNDDPKFDKGSNKIVFVIDEWDWIYDRYGDEAKSLLTPLVKVGAGLNIQVILVGQSPLTGDTGLSQSFYHNMVRVAIWQEGARLLNNYPLDKDYKTPLMAEYEALKELAPRHERQTGDKLRYCVVVPMAGNPTVQVIPVLADPEPIKPTVIEPPRPTAEERIILRAWWKMKDQEKIVATELHRAIRPDLSSKPSKQQLDKYRSVIKKFGYDPKF